MKYASDHGGNDPLPALLAPHLRGFHSARFFREHYEERRSLPRLKAALNQREGTAVPSTVRVGSSCSWETISIRGIPSSPRRRTVAFERGRRRCRGRIHEKSRPKQVILVNFARLEKNTCGSTRNAIETPSVRLASDGRSGSNTHEWLSSICRVAYARKKEKQTDKDTTDIPESERDFEALRVKENAPCDRLRVREFRTAHSPRREPLQGSRDGGLSSRIINLAENQDGWT